MFRLFRRPCPPTPRCDHIVVTQETFAETVHPSFAVNDLVTFVNAMQTKNLFYLDELPRDATALYHADHYVCQVHNGGHSQYLNNGGIDQRAQQLAYLGLNLIGATGYAACLDMMVKWARDNDAEARAQNGFSQRAEFLEALDTRLYNEDQDAYLRQMRDWLAASPLVRRVPAKDFQTSIQEARAGNPVFDIRSKDLVVDRLQREASQGLLALFRAAMGHTCTAEGKLLEIQRIVCPVTAIEAEWDHSTGEPPSELIDSWGLATSVGPLVGHVGVDKVAFLKGTPEQPYFPAKVLWGVERRRCEAAREKAREQMPALIASALLTRVNPGAEMAYIAPIAIGEPADATTYIIRTKPNLLYLLVIDQRRAVIGSAENPRPMASLGAKEMSRLRRDFDFRMNRGSDAPPN